MNKKNTKDIIIIDGHTDIPRDIYLKEEKGEKEVFMRNHYTQLKESNVKIFFANVFTKTSTKLALKESLLQVEKMIKVTRENKDIVLIKNKDDLNDVLETEKLGVILSLEGLEPLSDSVDLLNIYYELGMRAGMLTWNASNHFASGSEKNGGITKIGKSAIKKMNELGILIDVSHLNEEGFWDVVKLNQKPMVASHSNSKALFNHNRNLTDDQIKAIANTGGIIGVVSYFSKAYEKNLSEVRLDDDETETIHDFIKHIEYIISLVGYDHVAFGFDFNMYLGDFGVKGLESAGKIQNVVDLLLKRGHKVEDVKKVSSNNWIKILNSTLK